MTAPQDLQPGTPVAGVYADRLVKRRVVSWALWDWGSSSFNAVATTFVFSTYLASSVAVHGAPAGGPEPTTWIAIGSVCAAVLIAVIAPVLGQRSDATGHRKRNLLICTVMVVLCLYAMVLVRNDFSYLFLGLVLLNLGAVFSELGGVSYNAMLNQVATPATAGRVSGIGWASGYVGGIVLLLILFVGFINPAVGWFGVTSAGGWNIRISMVLAATWFAVSAIALFVNVPEVAANPALTSGRIGPLAAYRKLFGDIADLWRTDRNAVVFLIASALYRDGLAGVFSFGAILAARVWGLSASQVIIFGVGANVVAALGAAVGGLLDDRVGPRSIVLSSLIGLVAVAVTLEFVHATSAFWVLGLALCLFVGPAQSSSRVILSRVAPAGHEGQMFGLYATTGRAVSFLCPALVALLTGITGNERLTIIAVAIVLAAGLAVMFAVRTPPRGRPMPHVEQVTMQA